MVKVGYKSYVGIGNESVYGTFVTSTAYVPFNSESFKLEISEILVDAVNGTPHYQSRVQGQKKVSGSLDVPLQGGNAGLLNLFKAVTGSTPVATTVAVGVYQYLMPFRGGVNNNSLSLQIARDTADSTATFNYTGCKVNSCQISCDNAGLAKASFEFMGKAQTLPNTISTASYNSNVFMSFKNGTISIGDSITVATTTTFQNFNIQLNNNLIEDRVIGNQDISLLEASMSDATVTLERLWADNNLYNRFLNNTPTYIKIVLSGDSITAAHNNEIQFEFFNAYCNGNHGNISNAKDLLKESLSFRSIYSNASATACLVTIKTSLATF